MQEVDQLLGMRDAIAVCVAPATIILGKGVMANVQLGWLSINYLSFRSDPEVGSR